MLASSGKLLCTTYTIVCWQEKEEKKKLLENIKELEENCKQLMEIEQDIHTRADEALCHLQRWPN